MRHIYQIGEKYTTKNYGDLEIIGKKDGFCQIKFLKTGYVTWIRSSKLKNGDIKDPLVEKHIPWYGRNEPFKANDGSTGVIFAQRCDKVLVKFDETNHISLCFLENVRKGKLRDPYKKSFLGIGFLGEYENLPHTKQAKQLWSNMMKRCYNPKDEKGYFGKGVVVDERWHCFANFLDDLPKLLNFDCWLLGHKEGNDRYNLDKDFLVKGNKVYSRELCIFLEESENKGLGKRNKTLVNGEWVEKA